MALDKAVDSATLDAGLTKIANAIRAKGGTDGTMQFPDEFAALIEAIEAGGGGASGITYGVYIPTSTGTSHTIEHALGVVPKLFAICSGALNNTTSASFILDSAHGFSDRNLLFRMSRMSASSSPSGYICNYNDKNITQQGFMKNTALAGADSNTIAVGGNYTLLAGNEYYWFAIA